MTWNGAHLLTDCLDAILPEGAPILVIDNASTDGTAALLAEAYPEVRVIRNASNTGFAGGVATALETLRAEGGDYALLLNNDARVRGGWVKELLSPLENDPGIAAVTSKLVLPDGTMNSAGGWLGPSGYGHDLGFGEPDDGRWDSPTEVAYGCGGGLALRLKVLDEVPGFDPRFFLYYEDVDLSWRLWLAGWKVVYQPTAVAMHLHSATTGAGSLRHTYWTERNRLATLVTCATPALALRMIARYPLTTISVARGESKAKALQRVKAFGSFLRWLPELLVRRRQVVTKLSRRDFQGRFLAPQPPRAAGSAPLR